MSDGGAPCPPVTWSYQPGRTVTSVWVSGSFNGWAATPGAGAVPMTGPDGDGVWTASRPLPPGVHEYKLIVDATQWMADPANPNRHGANDNSVVVAQACAPTPPEPACGEAQFWLDLGAGQASSVWVSGTFNGWGASDVTAWPMSDPGATGAWSLTRGLAAGTYQYKLVVTVGAEVYWLVDPNNASTAQEGGVTNSMLQVAACSSSSSGTTSSSSGDCANGAGLRFNWRNATLYQVMVDRFRNGDTTNDHAYGRGLQRDGTPRPGFRDMQGTFHGGDLVGLKAAVEEGYFDNLGVSALWITAPYEQIHGWIAHPERFRYHAYHGYWPLDFTEVDANLGTGGDLRDLVDACHRRGLRILLDVVLNHPGYISLSDMAEQGFGQARAGWETFYLDTAEGAVDMATYDSYLDFSAGTAPAWGAWWGPSWVRQSIEGEVNGVPLPGYQPFGAGTLGEGQFGLPDFKTESGLAVGIPPVLATKWDAVKEAQEVAELEAYFSSTGRSRTVRGHLVKWLTDWVEELGVDGFRCDTVTHVEFDAWAELKAAGDSRLAQWKRSHPGACLDQTPFWMVGEGGDYLVDGPEFYAHGMDAMLNFGFRQDPRFLSALQEARAIEPLYAEYAAFTEREPVSFISAHDFGLFFDGDVGRQKRAGTLLLLAPRAVNILYGDENARSLGPPTWDAQQRIRSDMAFPGDGGVADHWARVARFRRAHVAIGAGTHLTLRDSPYTFVRTLGGDKVLCVLDASGVVDVNVGGVFPDGTWLTEAYGGQTAQVASGVVRLDAGSGHPLLLSP